eukprot:GHVH01004186.1.p1 GENE.GHVH01004186.1~~GHVH01004186.1.p1  ORF type:complete len:381 (+),score=58.59 GHVH01004186.1:49-1143(+)
MNSANHPHDASLTEALTAKWSSRWDMNQIRNALSLALEAPPGVSPSDTIEFDEKTLNAFRNYCWNDIRKLIEENRGVSRDLEAATRDGLDLTADREQLEAAVEALTEETKALKSNIDDVNRAWQRRITDMETEWYPNALSPKREVTDRFETTSSSRRERFGNHSPIHPSRPENRAGLDETPREPSHVSLNKVWTRSGSSYGDRSNCYSLEKLINSSTARAEERTSHNHNHVHNHIHKYVHPPGKKARRMEDLTGTESFSSSTSEDSLKKKREVRFSHRTRSSDKKKPLTTLCSVEGGFLFGANSTHNLSDDLDATTSTYSNTDTFEAGISNAEDAFADNKSDGVDMKVACIVSSDSLLVFSNDV